MRALLMLVLLVTGLWSAWWFYGAHQTRLAFEGWLAERAAMGETAEAEIEVHGFPSRFDTTLSDLRIGFGGGWLWEADLFQTLMLAYAPNRAVAVWPGPQRLTDPLGTVTVLEGEEARASVRVGIDAALPLNSITLVARDVAVDGAGWQASLDELRFAARAGEGIAAALGEDSQYHIGIELDRLALPEVATAGGALPGEVGQLRIDAVADFDKPLELNTAVPALLEQVRVAEITLDWGEVSLSAGDGVLRVDGDGFLVGSLPLEIRGYSRIVDALAALGVLPERQAGLALTGLSLLTGGDEAITVPLSFSGGETRLGPIPLGPAPQVVQRQ